MGRESLSSSFNVRGKKVGEGRGRGRGRQREKRIGAIMPMLLRIDFFNFADP